MKILKIMQNITAYIFKQNSLKIKDFPGSQVRLLLVRTVSIFPEHLLLNLPLSDWM